MKHPIQQANGTVMRTIPPHEYTDVFLPRDGVDASPIARVLLRCGATWFPAESVAVIGLTIENEYPNGTVLEASVDVRTTDVRGFNAEGPLLNDEPLNVSTNTASPDEPFTELILQDAYGRIHITADRFETTTLETSLWEA